MVMVGRGVVHDALMGVGVASKAGGVPPEDVEWGRKVRGVREMVTDDGVEVEVEFCDGSVERADLVIGADGVRSVVRECMFEGKYPAQYEYVFS